MAGVIRLAVLIAVGILWLTVLMPFRSTAGDAMATPPAAAAIGELERMLRPPAPLRLDLYDNPVDDAIRDYGVDGHGRLYERHSGDPAAARLPAPTL